MSTVQKYSIDRYQRYSDDWLNLVRRERAIAVIRAEDLQVGRKMAQAVAAGGMKLIEIAANSDRPWQLIELLRQELPLCSIGTGTILSLDDLRNAIAAGAEYAFMPHVDLSQIAAAIAVELPIVPGALSPTEILTAWQAGVTAVKIFPVQAVGGARYLQVLQGPIGHIPLIPTGGVTDTTAPDFIAAGAVAVGLAGSLFPQAEVLRKDWQSIRNRASKLMARLHSSAPIH